MKTVTRALLTLFAFAAATLAVDTQYKTRFITSATLTIHVKDGQYITIKNFTQDQDVGAGRGVLDAGIPPPSPTPSPIPTPTSTPSSTDLTATKTDNVGGHTTFPGPWTWIIHVANVGGAAANFTSGQTILSDSLPNANITYGSPLVSNQSGVTTISASINCAIDGSFNLTCSVSGTQVVIASAGSFDVSFTATPTAAGSFANPRPAGACSVDPNNVVAETNDSNNACGDTVVSDSSPPTPTPTATATPTPIKAGVLTAALLKNPPLEFVKPITIAGPATLTIDPVPGATLTITYRKSLQPIQPTATVSPTSSSISTRTSTSTSSVTTTTIGTSTKSSRSDSAIDSTSFDEDDIDWSTPTPTPTPTLTPTPTPTLTPVPTATP